MLAGPQLVSPCGQSDGVGVGVGVIWGGGEGGGRTVGGGDEAFLCVAFSGREQ